MVSRENLIDSFFRFRTGKKSKEDILEFSMNLSKEIDQLHLDLMNQTYCHGDYKHFVVNDPKRRDIHKASVRDRVVHHALYNALHGYFDNLFIHDSYSCRLNKGTHKAIYRMQKFIRQVSLDYQKRVYILKCDIQKFFANIDHNILKDLLRKHISDKNTLWLLTDIIGSFHTPGFKNKGLPLGNLTSQLLVNIYMNEFDHFVKREMKDKFYIRYADDFIFISDDRDFLLKKISLVNYFLKTRLSLSIHPKKVFIENISLGIDFLGWKHFPHHRILRSNTRKRMMRKLRAPYLRGETLQSYLGLLKHGNTHKLRSNVGGKIIT